VGVDPLLTTGLGPLLALLGALGAAYLTYRVSNRKLRSDSGHQMIDQLQEELKGVRAELAASQRANRLQGDYIGVLRRHIANGDPPPPPAWPEGLIT
jgi:hypothetical protein